MRKVHSLFTIVIMLTVFIAGCGQQLTKVQPEPITGIDEGAVKVIYEDEGPSQGGILNLFMVSPKTLNPLTTQDPYVR